MGIARPGAGLPDRAHANAYSHPTWRRGHRYPIGHQHAHTAAWRYSHQHTHAAAWRYGHQHTYAAAWRYGHQHTHAAAWRYSHSYSNRHSNGHTDAIGASASCAYSDRR